MAAAFAAFHSRQASRPGHGRLVLESPARRHKRSNGTLAQPLMDFLTEEFTLLESDMPPDHKEAEGIVAHAQSGLNDLRITEATTKLFDAYIPAGRDADRFARAFRHWKKLLAIAFPHVMDLLGEEILTRLGEKNVGTVGSVVLLKTALEPYKVFAE